VRWLAAWLLLGLVGPLHTGCDRMEISPGVMRPGWRLFGPEATEPVHDWSFAADLRTLELETRAPWGWHSVRLWFAVADGHLYVAIYRKEGSFLWARLLRRNPRARVRLGDTLYPVEGTLVSDPASWRAALEALESKYGARLEPYDYPRPDAPDVGTVFELRSRRP
jgi:hypothetical protein